MNFYLHSNLKFRKLCKPNHMHQLNCFFHIFGNGNTAKNVPFQWVWIFQRKNYNKIKHLIRWQKRPPYAQVYTPQRKSKSMATKNLTINEASLANWQLSLQSTASENVKICIRAFRGVLSFTFFRTMWARTYT